MSTSVFLDLRGTHEAVQHLLERLARDLGDDGVVWIDERNNPFPGSDPAYDLYDGTIELEFFRQERRAGAIGQANGMVNAYDPQHDVVKGGDIFKRGVD